MIQGRLGHHVLSDISDHADKKKLLNNQILYYIIPKLL